MTNLTGARRSACAASLLVLTTVYKGHWPLLLEQKAITILHQNSPISLIYTVSPARRRLPAGTRSPYNTKYHSLLVRLGILRVPDFCKIPFSGSSASLPRRLSTPISITYTICVRFFRLYLRLRLQLPTISGSLALTADNQYFGSRKQKRSRKRKQRRRCSTLHTVAAGRSGRKDSFIIPL